LNVLTPESPVQSRIHEDDALNPRWAKSRLIGQVSKVWDAIAAPIPTAARIKEEKVRRDTTLSTPRQVEFFRCGANGPTYDCPGATSAAVAWLTWSGYNKRCRQPVPIAIAQDSGGRLWGRVVPRSGDYRSNNARRGSNFGVPELRRWWSPVARIAMPVSGRD
jgi:hypothetical protein